MALIIRKKISLAIISLISITGIITGLTGYSTYASLSGYSFDITVTDMMFLLSILGITWASVLDYLLLNLFSKQLVVIELPGVTKFHVKNALSFCIWLVSLLWGCVLFTVMTLPQQMYLEYYPIYILVFAVFYSIMSMLSFSWRANKQWWLFDIFLIVFVKLMIPIITASIFVLIFKLI